MTPLSRREAVRRLASASAGLALSDVIISGQSAPISVAGKQVEIVVSSISDSTVRITTLPVEGLRIPDDGSLVAAAAGQVVARWRAVASSVVPAGKLTVRITSSPPVIEIDSAGKTVQRLTLDAVSTDVGFRLGDGPILGLGEGGPQFDRKGIIDRGRNGQGGYQLRTHGGRVPIQWLVGTGGWGMYIHQPLGAFDLTGSDGRFTPASDAPLDVFISTSPDPKVIVAEYARITGRAELPALWSFGYMQSHRTLAGPDEVMSVARTFREKHLPCDALIYLGTEFTPSGWNTRNGEFDWKKENFPDPRQMIAALHAQHFRVVLHVVIEGHRMSGTVHDACTPDKAVPSGRTPDDKWPDDRAVPCYWPYHKPVYDLGIDGWWPDQGDGLDQPSRLARIRMYWEGPQLWRPNERPFALHRNGAPGMQRYGAFLWSGDVYSTWETLKTHVGVAINTGLSGMPFWGTDIGGFVPTPEYTGELHVRWFQFGAFCPLFRAHGRTWHLRLPWGWNTGEVGPSETRGYTGGAGEPDVGELQYLELRYRMLPYVYSIARECCESGLPMMRALWLHHPDDLQATARGDQYLWGRDLLVSPVVEKGATSRRLYLPRGEWFDFWTEERIGGGREIDRPVDLATMPLHVRAGALLPFGPVKQYADQVIDQPLSLVVYPGANGEFTLYEDDGRTFNYRRGEWMGLEMRWRDAEKRLTLQLAPGARMMPPLRREIDVRIAGDKSSRQMVFTGRPVTANL